MRRIDKAMNDARALRVARALRARGHATELGDGGAWMQEVLAGQALVDVLRRPARDGEPALIDTQVLAPFVERARDVLVELFKVMDPAGVVAEHVGRQAVAAFGITDDYARFYESAARDLGMLTAEALLFEVIRGVILSNDRARPTRQRSDRIKVTIEDGRVRRLRQRPSSGIEPSAATIGLGPLPAAAAVEGVAETTGSSS